MVLPVFKVAFLPRDMFACNQNRSRGGRRQLCLRVQSLEHELQIAWAQDSILFAKFHRRRKWLGVDVNDCGTIPPITQSDAFSAAALLFDSWMKQSPAVRSITKIASSLVVVSRRVHNMSKSNARRIKNFAAVTDDLEPMSRIFHFAASSLLPWQPTRGETMESKRELCIKQSTYFQHRLW